MIYHITTHTLWDKALNEGKDRGSYGHPSIAEEGFIHCSTRAQIPGTLEAHFQAEKEVLILHVQERQLRNILRWEASRNGEEFPHIYGRIPLTVIQDVEIVMRDEQGTWVLEE